MTRKPNTRGGVRANAGPIAEFTDGLPLRAVSVKLDPVTITIARSIGDGQMSKGIRKAIRQVCRSRRVGDQMLCGFCGLSWDMTDPEPPKCNLENALIVRAKRERGKRT